jgi:hypothetical protein
MQSKQKMIDSYKYYGFNFPLKAYYKRQNNRVYFSGDFEDNEEIEFFWNCDKPSAYARGNAFYMNKNKMSKLINIKELEPINCNN